ncbi:MAG: M20/M25/M40 family metallo-hydrolase [Planctomycetes bacterium]|nr:M20/M25/M40 family metallo-hydrolase [Planctomycetota bacterium]
MANQLLASVTALLFLTATVTGQTSTVAGEGLAQDRKDGAAQVTVEQVKAWIGTLASPAFEGRGTGQEGYRKAAEFMRDYYQSLGLEPAGDGGTFFQKVPWSATKVDADKTSLQFSLGDKQVLVPLARLGGNVSKTFAGKGAAVLITTNSAKAIEKLTLKDKVALLLVGSEDMKTRMGLLVALQEKGAVAVIFAQRDPVQGVLQGRPGARGNRAVAGARLAPALVSFGGDDLTALMTMCGLNIDKLSGESTELTGVTAELQATISELEAPAWNVCARLPGSDKELQKEYVVIGSHLDHLGMRGEIMYPGADDDGSGSTGVLAVATMLAKNKVRPARSILFLNFCGEEMGLIGSRHFADHPTIPLSAIVGELQMDMIGRNEEENSEGDKGEKAEDNKNSLHLVGSKKISMQLHELCMQKNSTAKFDLEWDQEGMFSRSDHANFARMGVPIAFFFTGLHRDYHKPTDTPDKIENQKLLRVATYVYDIAFELAQQAGRPMVDPELWEKYRGKGSEQPAAPMSAPNKEASGAAKDEAKAAGK